MEIHNTNAKRANTVHYDDSGSKYLSYFCNSDSSQTSDSDSSQISDFVNHDIATAENSVSGKVGMPPTKREFTYVKVMEEIKNVRQRVLEKAKGRAITIYGYHSSPSNQYYISSQDYQVYFTELCDALKDIVGMDWITWITDTYEFGVGMNWITLDEIKGDSAYNEFLRGLNDTETEEENFYEEFLETLECIETELLYIEGLDTSVTASLRIDTSLLLTLPDYREFDDSDFFISSPSTIINKLQNISKVFLSYLEQKSSSKLSKEDYHKICENVLKVLRSAKDNPEYVALLQKVYHKEDNKHFEIVKQQKYCDITSSNELDESENILIYKIPLSILYKLNHRKHFKWILACIERILLNV